MTRILLIAFLLEAGFMLVVIPWSPYWDHNYFAAAIPAVHRFIINNFVRGAVSGLGVVNATAAVVELVAPLFVRRSPARQSVGITPSATADE
jgi:hypothetical protein